MVVLPYFAVERNCWYYHSSLCVWSPEKLSTLKDSYVLHWPIGGSVVESNCSAHMGHAKQNHIQAKFSWSLFYKIIDLNE